MPAEAQTTPALKKRTIDYHPSDSDTLKSSRYRSITGSGRAAIHPADPYFPGGMSHVTILWANGHVDSFQQQYSDQAGLIADLNAKIIARQQDEDKQLMALKDKLKQLESIERTSGREYKRTKDTIEYMENTPIYAVQHLRLGIWGNKGVMKQGRLDKAFHMPDTAVILPFKSIEEVEEYNKGRDLKWIKKRVAQTHGREVEGLNLYPVTPIECRPFDNEVRRYIPEWVVLGR